MVLSEMSWEGREGEGKRYPISGAEEREDTDPEISSHGSSKQHEINL
jgi:hypothetical protein